MGEWSGTTSFNLWIRSFYRTRQHQLRQTKYVAFCFVLSGQCFIPCFLHESFLYSFRLKYFSIFTYLVKIIFQ
jgi:hypothetical protein